MEMGLAYGDIIAFRQIFNITADNVKTYKERADELKQRLKRNHSGKNDSLDRPVTIKAMYNVTIGLKCFEKLNRVKKMKYVLKTNKSFAIDVPKSSSYEHIHQIARERFQIPSTKETFLGSYAGTNLIESFDDVEGFALAQKDRKKGLHVYLHYPKSYANLELSRHMNNECDNDDLEDFLLPDVQDIHALTYLPLHQPSNNLAEPSSNRQICTLCGSTYEEHCMICEQNTAYQASLLTDVAKAPAIVSSIASLVENAESFTQSQQISTGVATPSSEEDEPVKNPETQEDLRNARLRNLPLRYRHSIDSPSLAFSTRSTSSPSFASSTSSTNSSRLASSTSSASSSSLASTSSTPLYVFGDGEVERFFANAPNLNVLDSHETTKSSEPDLDLETFIKEASHIYNRKMIGKDEEVWYVIVQRNPGRFWSRLLNQSYIDVTQRAISVRFAGESGADMGGPLREFLTLFVKRFSSIPGMLFGTEENMFIKMLPDSIRSNKYFMLGQLTGLSIITIGRGPECLNPTVVKAMLNSPFENDDIVFENGELNDMVLLLEQGKTDFLLDYDIPLSCVEDLTKCKRMLIQSVLILKNFSAIEQYGRGLKSIAECFTCHDNYTIMETFLVHCPTKEVSLPELLSVIKFLNHAEEGSNKYEIISNSICDTELFFASVANGKVAGFSLEDILFMFTGMERIPPFGFEKQIEIDFIEDNTPKISTCTLTVSLPMNDIETTLLIGLKFGCGFGDI